MSHDWQEFAACVTTPAEVFFPDLHHGRRRREDEAAAKAICATCPVVDACLEHAIDADEPAGIWGGLNEIERHQIRRRRSA